LKQGNHINTPYKSKVAPRAGAWIETRYGVVLVHHQRSPPARGRGLKPASSDLYSFFVKSPPARGRGLKLAIGLVHGGVPSSPPARGRGLKLDLLE